MSRKNEPYFGVSIAICASQVIFLILAKHSENILLLIIIVIIIIITVVVIIIIYYITWFYDKTEHTLYL